MEKEDRHLTIPEEEILIEVPRVYDQKLQLNKINWLEDLGGGYFQAGLTNLKHRGGSVWLLLLDPEVGFKPILNTSQPGGEKK